MRGQPLRQPIAMAQATCQEESPRQERTSGKRKAGGLAKALIQLAPRRAVVQAEWRLLLLIRLLLLKRLVLLDLKLAETNSQPRFRKVLFIFTQVAMAVLTRVSATITNLQYERRAN